MSHRFTSFLAEAAIALSVTLRVLAGCGCGFCLVGVWVFCVVALFGLLPPRVRSFDIF